MLVTAGMVKNLRQRTNAGMMECKKALVESEGDIEKAVELLRKKGAASAEKKAGRIAAEGKIVQKISADGKHGVLIEVNCETDFVARADSFAAFADQVADCVADRRPGSLDQLLDGTLKTGERVEDARNTLIGRIGENVSVRRFQIVEVEEARKIIVEQKIVETETIKTQAIISPLSYLMIIISFIILVISATLFVTSGNWKFGR